MKTIRNLISDFAHDESGASGAEYALILSIVGAGIAAAALFLGGAVANSINDAGTCISSNGGTCN